MSYVYRFKCTTDTSLQTETRTYEQGEPTFNPSDPTDLVDVDSVTIIETIDPQLQAVNEYVQNVAGETTILTGSATWDSGLTFEVTALSYLILGIYHTAPATQITLDTADGSFDRIDLIVADDTGAISKITGTPAATPSAPTSLDSNVVVTVVTVPAASSIPDVSTSDLYLENAGSGSGEWDWVENTSNVELKLASTNNPYEGTICIEAVNATAGNRLTATLPTTYDTAAITLLEIAIRPKASWPGTKRLKFTFFNNGTQNGQTLALDDGDLGFNSSLIQYQIISVPKANFVLTGNEVDELRIEVSGGGVAIGFYLDRIRFQTGEVSAANTHIPDTNNPHQTTKAQVGLGNVANILNGSGAVDPTASEDNTAGYSVSSRWVNTLSNKEFVCTNSSTGAAVWVETTVASIGGASSAFNAYSTTNESVGDVYTDMPMHAQRISSGDFMHVLSSPEVTINTADTFLVVGTCSIDVTSGTSRTVSECKWQINTGAGYVDVPGTNGQEYHREVLEGGGTMTMPFVNAFSVGDKIKMQARRVSGTNTLVFKQQGCSINIVKMKGEQGPQGTPGVDGIDGADGAPGAGSSIIVKDEGSNVANTPHTAINFIGGDVAVTDGGSGVADITLTAPVPIFGSEWQNWESSVLFTNNSTTYISKTGFPVTTTSVPAGTYRVGWAYGWSHNNATNDFRGRILVDSIIKMEHQQEPKDSAATNGQRPSVGSGTDQLHRVAGFFYITTVSTDTHTIDLQINSNSATIISSVFDVHIEFWRVA